MKKREKRRFSLAARFGILFYAAALLLIVALSAASLLLSTTTLKIGSWLPTGQPVSAKAQTINDLLSTSST